MTVLGNKNYLVPGVLQVALDGVIQRRGLTSLIVVSQHPIPALLPSLHNASLHQTRDVKAKNMVILTTHVRARRCSHACLKCWAARSNYYTVHLCVSAVVRGRPRGPASTCNTSLHTIHIQF